MARLRSNVQDGVPAFTMDAPKYDQPLGKADADCCRQNFPQDCLSCGTVLRVMSLASLRSSFYGRLQLGATAFPKVWRRYMALPYLDPLPPRMGMYDYIDPRTLLLTSEELKKSQEFWLQLSRSLVNLCRSCKHILSIIPFDSNISNR